MIFTAITCAPQPLFTNYIHIISIVLLHKHSIMQNDARQHFFNPESLYFIQNHFISSRITRDYFSDFGKIFDEPIGFFSHHFPRHHPAKPYHCLGRWFGLEVSGPVAHHDHNRVLDAAG